MSIVIFMYFISNRDDFMKTFQAIIAALGGFLFAAIIGGALLGENCPVILYLILWLGGAIGITFIIGKIKGE